MLFQQRRKLAYLMAMLGTSSSLSAAVNLPPLPVSPALLGGNVPANPSGAARGERSRMRVAPAVSGGAPVAGADTAGSMGGMSGSARSAPQRFAGVSSIAGVTTGDADAGQPVLKLALKLEKRAPNKADPGSTFIAAGRIRGRTDVDVLAEGDVELRKVGNVLTTDRLSYNEAEDVVDATGNVRLVQGDDVIAGPHLHLKIDANVGFFEEPKYALKRTKTRDGVEKVTTASGEAKRIDFEGENHYRLTNATYSTCGPDNPDWYAEAREMELDYVKEEGISRDTKLVFEGVPILYSPWLTFPLNNQRKSGFLAPTIGSTNTGGLEAMVPYYWNIAPNMDATLSPRLMLKRGLELDGEFRYLDQNYYGIFQGAYLPSDQIANTSRNSYALQHRHNLGMGFFATLDLNGVSDDMFFSDLSSRLSNIAQSNLLRRGVLSYSSTWWNVSVMAENHQILKDPSALTPPAIPYRRLPQINLNAYRGDLPGGLVFAFAGEDIQFSHGENLSATTTTVQGRRSDVYPQVSLPIQTPGYFITPKIGLHSTRYTLESPPAGTPEHLSRSVPIFSLDGGMVFERNLQMYGRDVVQTLEPRLFYLNVPNREQSLIPSFDTGVSDFNLAQVFSENRYSSIDRIGDANQLTAIVMSRILDQDSGAEIVRGGIGQRYYFKEQQVTLPGETPRTSNTADFIAALGGQVMPKLYLDSGLQFSPHDHRINRFNVLGLYRQEPGKTVSASYRYTRDPLNPNSSTNEVKQFDVAAQWPLWHGWSGVGRYNYSLIDHHIIESMAGLEYNAGCWVSRFVLQRVATGTGGFNSGFFMQLELNGLAGIGSNPMELLKRSILGYGRSGDAVTDAFFPVSFAPVDPAE